MPDIKLKNVLVSPQYLQAWETRAFLANAGIRSNIVQRFAVQVAEVDIEEAAGAMAFYEKDWRNDGRYNGVPERESESLD